jgi:hypothetical protein
VEGIQVNPNVTIAELERLFGPASTPDAEVGFHSEACAAEWFRLRPDLHVLQIFSERVPCIDKSACLCCDTITRVCLDITTMTAIRG